MNKLMIFEGNNVEIIRGENGEPLFELYSTGMALGQIVMAKGTAYANKKRIEKNISNAGIEPVLRNAKLYLTEEMLYDFMLEAKTDKCRAFRKWVTHEVLPSIRKDGGYMVASTEESDEEILARAILVAQKTIERKNEQIKELEDSNHSLQTANNALLSKVEEDAPKVEFAETVTNSEDCIDFATFSQVCVTAGVKNIGRNRLVKFLKDKKVLKSNNTPYQSFVDRGYFKVVEVAKKNYYGGMVMPKTLITGKGQPPLLKFVLENYNA